MLGEIKKSLVEIVESNKIVLIDSCVDNPFIGESIVPMFYDCKDLFALNAEQKEFLGYEVEHTNFMIELIDSHDNVFTIPEISREMHEKNKIIGENYRFNSNKRERKIKIGRAKCGSDVEYIKECLDSIYNLSQKLKDIEKRPDYGTLFLYNTIFNNIKMLNESTGLIKEKPKYYPYPRKKEKTIKSDTDERLATMAFYLSITNDTDVAFISNDGDLKGLTGTPYSMFHAGDIALPENRLFQKMKKYSPKMYSKLGTEKYEGYRLFFDTKEATKIDLFKIFKKPEESDTIKKLFLENIMNAEKEAAEILT